MIGWKYNEPCFLKIELNENIPKILEYIGSKYKK